MVLTCLDIAFVVVRAIHGPWLYIVLTFILLTLGVVWCHSLCRLIVAVYQFPNHATEPILQIGTAEATGYAQPEQPIFVTMAGDEEHLAESRTIPAMKIATPPPAYGLWRSSVVSGYTMNDNREQHTTNLRAEAKS